MRKVIFTLLCLGAMHIAFSQTTYYWVGGTSAASSFTANSNWNTVKGSTAAGTTRAASDPTDILIFDGTDYGGGVNTGTATAIITSTSCAEIILQNNASVNLQRQTNSSGTITITGGAGDDLVVPTGSTLTISSSDPAGSGIVSLSAAATGLINGTVNITGGGSRLACLNATAGGALFFQSGSTANVNVILASNYPFGGSASQAANYAIVFKSGSSIVYQGGNSIFGNTSTVFPIVLQTGSTVYFDASASSVSGMFGSRTYSNVTIRNGSSVTLGDNFYNIDNLTINAGCSFNIRSTGTAPIAGNIINNGTFGAAAGWTSSHVILDGTTPQTVGGTGTFTPVGAFSVATDADVTLNTNISVGSSTSTASPTSTITGKLNVQNFTINSTGTTTAGPFSLRAASNVAGSAATVTAGTNVVMLSDYTNANVGIGLLVSGTGIPANTYIISTSTTNSQFTMSKPATITGSTTITTFGNAPTITTSNVNGLDGSITTTGTRSFGSGTNYIFNAATTAPFAAGTTNNAGNVTFNAAATVNRSIDVTGTLTLNSGSLTIPSIDTVGITSGNAVAGGPFSASKYIITQVDNATGAEGVLRIDNFSAATLFPVGSVNNYLPVTLTPLSTSSFAVSSFEGITQDGTPNGTAMTAAQKTQVVNAVWRINRLSANVDNCDVKVNWVSSLEGSAFAGFANNQIGVSRYNGSSWTVVGGSGDNTANFATNTFNTFSPFGVGRLGVVLPLRFLSFDAVLANNKVVLKWNVQNELGLDKYNVERSADGINFNSITNVAAKNLLSSEYNFIDPQALSTTAYYRIKSIAANGQVNYTGIVKVGSSKAAQLEIYPNPVRGNIINLSFSPAVNGNYTLLLINSAGQQVMSKSLGQVQGNFNASINLPNTVQPGLYTLILTSNDSQLKQSILIQ